jgi:hypothetical protein
VDEPTELEQLIDTWLAQEFASWLVNARYSGQYQTVSDAVQRLKQRLKGRSIERPATDGEYRSPYMLLMERAVRALNITEDNQPKAEALTAWFYEQDSRACPVSPSLARRLATALRTPAMRKGGQKKMRKRPTPLNS